MPVVYVVRSRGLGKWGADVGLTKHVYKFGIADESAEAAVKALNEAGTAGHSDWKLAAKKQVEAIDENAAFERIGRREKLVDPSYYPGIKGARGVFKVKPANVENSFFMKQAIAGGEMKDMKMTPELIGEYLINVATAA